MMSIYDIQILVMILGIFSFFMFIAMNAVPMDTDYYEVIDELPEVLNSEKPTLSETFERDSREPVGFNLDHDVSTMPEWKIQEWSNIPPSEKG